MKIKINDFWLCEDGQLAPNSLRVNGRRLTQVAALIRSESSKVWNRRNSVTTVSFSVVREHDTVREAESYMLEHEVAIPGAGVTTFICYDEGGTESVFYFDTGSLETTEAMQIGCSTEHTYQLIGGRITTEKPS